MKILVIRTDKPQAEIGAFDDHKELSSVKWQAHRELSTTIHSKIKQILNENTLRWNDIQGIVFYAGPGSFTGLRIGASLANALKQGNQIPLVQKGTSNWVQLGIEALLTGENTTALPEYGAEPRITVQKK